MINITEILISAFVDRLRAGYRQNYGGLKSDYADIIAWAGSMALENIANSDALYHNVEHTIHVTVVGQEILRGRHLRAGGVTPEDWLHVIISLLCHDIGYVKGVCRGDGNGLYATGKGDERVRLEPGTTDASLINYHVDRGQRYVEERFGGNKIINAEIIKANIELTRFPVPESIDGEAVLDYPNLVRAADLIGQLSDPRYLKKFGALFYEFEEIGINKAIGYRNPGDLLKSYPQFYWTKVYPYIKGTLPYLSLTQEGKQITASLYSNLFLAENQDPEHHFPSLRR